MVPTAKKVPHLSVDGKLFPCQPAGECGFLGDRILCDLGATGGQPPKKLLVRPLDRPQKESGGRPNNALAIDNLPDPAGIGLRPLTVKTYDYAIPSNDGALKRDQRQFLQQDVTGLVTLREAILKVVREGSPGKVWHLFYSACKALNNLGKSFRGQIPVPLQCPNGLAVDAKTGQVVTLDAELTIPTLSDSGETAFAKWFGSSGRDRYAQEKTAAALHSKALLLFFREVLGYLQKTAAAPATELTRLAEQLDGLATAKSLQELQDGAEKFAEDWSLPVDDENVAPVAAVAPPNKLDTRPVIRQEKPRTWFGWFVGSFLANLILAMLLFLCVGLWFLSNTRSSPGGGTNLPASDDPSLQFSSYCVVFPARGTSSEKVLTALKQLYPDKLIAPKQGETEQNQLLGNHLDRAVKQLKEVAEMQKLLGKLNSEHSIRFNGYSPDAEDNGLKAIIANGGLYRIASASEKVEHGSLLRAKSVERILAIAGMEKNTDAQKFLEALKTATHEYASIKDAVTVIGDRTAFIVRVEPTAKAHEAVRVQLLSRDGTPVFVPRPVFELFDAVDPAAGTGGGVARYSLKLDRKCNWRLVGSDDRRKTDYDNNPTNDKMKWSPKAANEEIKWTTLPVLRKNGRTDSVSSFDIALAVNDKVVIFRNQSILTGDSRDDVLKQARVYLNNLDFKTVALEDAINVGQQEERFTGALLYNFLADQAQTTRHDMEIMNSEQFGQVRKREDGDLGPAK